MPIASSRLGLAIAHGGRTMKNRMNSEIRKHLVKKPKPLLEGYLGKAISATMEVDKRKDLYKTFADSIKTSTTASGGVATTDGGTVYPSFWTKTATTSFGTWSSSTAGTTGWSIGFDPSVVKPAHLTPAQQEMIQDAIAQQLANPSPNQRYRLIGLAAGITGIGSVTTAGTTDWSLTYDEK